MFKSALLIASLLTVSYAVAVQPGGEGMPPGHPELPPGHPQTGPQAAPADPADVESIESIISAYYEVISAEKDVERDWGRFLSLFASEGRFVTTRTVGESIATMTLTPQQFIQFNQSYFSSTGYFEVEIHRQVDRFGNIAHIFSTYESKHTAADPEPYSRGINSIQLMSNGERWWIVSVMWDYERPGDNDLPAKYLPADAAQGEAEGEAQGG
jgi:hypothetical protein